MQKKKDRRIKKKAGKSGGNHVGKFCNGARRIAAHLVLTIDSSTPVGNMTFTVLGAAPELERSLIVERVRDGSATPVRKASGSGSHSGSRPPR